MSYAYRCPPILQLLYYLGYIFCGRHKTIAIQMIPVIKRGLYFEFEPADTNKHKLLLIVMKANSIIINISEDLCAFVIKKEVSTNGQKR